MKSRILLIFIYFLAWTSSAFTQTENKIAYPVVGQTVPDFTLHQINYYHKKQASSKDFRGKWLILDFWSRGCGSCVASWPKMNKLQEEFKDSVQLVLVGINSGHWGGKAMEKLYDTLKSKRGFNMVTVYDSLIAKNWGIFTVPHIVIVDPQGIVRAVTSSVDKDNLIALMSSKETTLRNKKNWFEEMKIKDPVNLNEPFYLNGNVGKDTDLFYRSILSRFDSTVDGMTRAIVPYLDHYLRHNRFIDGKAFWQAAGLDINQLYLLAFTGQTDIHVNEREERSQKDSIYFHFFKKPILEIRDSSLFQKTTHKGRITSLYNYSLMMPKEKASLESMKIQAQCDLKKYFGFDATIETRMMPYYKLTATEEAKKKLKSKGGKGAPYGNGDGYTGLHYINLPVSRIMYFISNSYDKADRYSFVDETGIEGNIDLNLNVMLDDKEAVLKKLRQNGLDVVMGYKKMKCIVIRDPK